MPDPPVIDLPEDDESIQDEWTLLRLVSVSNVAKSRGRPSTNAFRNASSEKRDMSVYVKEILEQHGLTIHDVLETVTNQGAAAFSAGFARSLRQVIVLSEGRFPGHADVIGEKPRHEVQFLLSDVAEWEVEVPGCECSPPVRSASEALELLSQMTRNAEP